MSTTTTDLWTVTETRRRLSLAAEAARQHSDLGIGRNYKVEIGTRLQPVAYDHRPSGTEVWATEKDGDDLADFVSPRSLKARDAILDHYAQIFTPGAVVHLYFTSPGQWGELVDVVTVWLGYGDAEPEVVGYDADTRADEAAQADQTTKTPAGYTADELDFLDIEDQDLRNRAARYASELIETARKTGKLYGETIPSPADAASAIGDLVASDYPSVGATDTVARESIYQALIGEVDNRREAAELAEEEAAEDLRQAQASPLVSGVPGWGIRRQARGLASQFWVELGRSLYGPFGTREAAQDELDAETKAANQKGQAVPTPTVAGDVEILTGFSAFAGGIVTKGDAVAVTFYPSAFDPTPRFGWVTWVDEDREAFTLDDVERGHETFTVSTVKTVAKIGRRQS